MTTFYHRTCGHRFEKIFEDRHSDIGHLFPHTQPLLGIKAIWFTHVRTADRAALALSSVTLDCDRMEHLLEVVDPHEIVHWSKVRGSFDREAVHQLEATHGARPEFWWLSGVAQNVRVVSP